MNPTVVVFRPASSEDCRLLWQWANEPGTRTGSFNPLPISWEEHQNWFARKRSDPEVLLQIATGPGGVPLGQVRFEIQNREAIISVSLDSACRGWSLGPEVIRKASRQLLDGGRVDAVIALVRQDNSVSRGAFLRAEFVEQAQTVVHGIPAIRLVLHR
jgi:RimJ/RimL family protein N-acetyltransferase